MTNNKAQDFVPIKDIKDGLMYMDDGRIKVVLAVSSLNLSLKAEEEQNAIISQFQGFLNTLDFPVQIQAESRRVDIRPYLDSLEDRLSVVTDELMKNQIREYRQFVKTFAEKTNIMNKRFFVIIDYDKGGDKSTNPMSSLMFFGKKKEIPVDDNLQLDSWRTQLEQRISIVAGGLSGVGLQVSMLGTEELIELFYKIYNPGQEGRSANGE
jgi:hypothetical protein